MKLKMKLKMSILLMALLMTITSALAFDSLNTACDIPSGGCHAFPSVFLKNNVSISNIKVAPGQTFPVTINWTGGVTAGTNTVSKWPNTVANNALFNPTPQTSTVGVFATGALTSTLTAPSAVGNYTLRAYTSDGTGTPNSGKETDYKVITIEVATPTPTPTPTPPPTGPTLTITLNSTMDGTSAPIVTNISSAVLLNKSGANVATATLPNNTTAKFNLSGITPSDYFIEINGLAGDHLPTRIDSTASDIKQVTGLRLRNSIIGDISNPTYRIKVYPSGLNSHSVVNYNTGFNESIFNFVIVPGNTSKFEVRVLNTSEELSNFSTTSFNHPFPTVPFQSWILDTPGAGATNHGHVYNNTDSNCNGCHGNLDTKVPTYSVITVGNGWCFRCHYGKTGPRNGYVDPRITVLATFNISGFKLNSNDNSRVSGWPISLLSLAPNSTLFQTVNTTTDGSYKFTNLTNGIYKVTEGTIAGWTPVGPTTLNVSINGSDVNNQNFTNKPPASVTGSISGFKINAVTGKGIPGWTITLSGTSNGINKTGTTGADGSYTFENLPAGNYLVKEKLRNDFKHVTNPVIHLDLSTGEKSVNNNFVNRPKEKGEKPDTE